MTRTSAHSGGGAIYCQVFPQAAETTALDWLHGEISKGGVCMPKREQVVFDPVSQSVS